MTAHIAALTISSATNGETVSNDSTCTPEGDNDPSNDFSNLNKIVNVIHYIILIRGNTGFPLRNINA